MASCKLPPGLRSLVEQHGTCIRSAGLNAKDYEQCRYETARKLEQAGAKFLGSGVERSAYRFDGCVLKLARSIYNLRENRKEVETYRSLPKPIRGMFVPIVDYDREGVWLTQPLAQVGGVSQDKRREIEKHIKMKIHEKGYYCSDLHDDNVGKWRGREAVVDYGQGIGACQRHEHGRNRIL